jgi:hypothetical protein
MDASATSSSAGSDWLTSTLTQIPTVFGRLVYLSSLQNPHSGAYEHEALGRLMGAQQADHALRYRHKKVFAEWVGASLDQQKRDLEVFLAADQTSRGDRVYDLNQVEPFRALIPASTREVERLLFVTDLETLLGMLRSERASPWCPEP